MAKKHVFTTDSALRQRATTDTALAAQAQRLVHELQVHQLELELQNEELRNARTELEESLARYADLYEFAPIGYLTLGRDGTIRQLNLTAARMLGEDRAQLIGGRFGLQVETDSRAAFHAFLEQVFAGRSRRICELSLGSDGAASLVVELTATASEGGQECRVVAADVTARKQAEREREQLQLQLVHAQRMEAIGTLAGGVAHDFNNILHGILGGLTTFEMGQVFGARSEIREMKALVERGADLARQLLGFARRGKYDVEPLELGPVLRQTCEMFARTRKDISVELSIAPELRPVLMDHTQLEQVLLNLFVNAGQAMLEGGTVRARVENVELGKALAATHGVEPGRFAKLVVSDTGIGMDAATQARIFEPFFTTKDRGRGTGLGLASAYGIVHSHGGFITVESQPEMGATFTLFFPTTDRAPLEEKLETALPVHGTGTILVVDDEDLILRTCSRMLEKVGYSVLTAASGAEALQVIRKHGDEISLVILDMIMPEMSGRQTYEALQQMQPGIKVLLASGYSLEGQAQDLLAGGCCAFLQKPFGLDVLSAKVREILSAPESATLSR